MLLHQRVAGRLEKVLQAAGGQEAGVGTSWTSLMIQGTLVERWLLVVVVALGSWRWRGGGVW